jgi:hypothetical protein
MHVHPVHPPWVRHWPTFHFFPDLDLSMLRNDPLRLPPFHFYADPDPAFHFDADLDPAYADADPDPQH